MSTKGNGWIFSNSLFACERLGCEGQLSSELRVKATSYQAKRQTASVLLLVGPSLPPSVSQSDSQERLNNALSLMVGVLKVIDTKVYTHTQQVCLSVQHDRLITWEPEIVLLSQLVSYANAACQVSPLCFVYFFVYCCEILLSSHCSTIKQRVAIFCYLHLKLCGIGMWHLISLAVLLNNRKFLEFFFYLPLLEWFLNYSLRWLPWWSNGRPSNVRMGWLPPCRKYERGSCGWDLHFFIGLPLECNCVFALGQS